MDAQRGSHRQRVRSAAAALLGDDIALETIGGAGIWKIECDVSELESALLNLALNARDAMPDGGKLTIETSNAYLDDEYCRHHADLTPGQSSMRGFRQRHGNVD